MKTLKFKTQINAPREKVWRVLWDDETYRKWTAAFSEGSYAVSDWNEGSKIQFLSSTGDGMHSEIAKKDENSFMSFRHLGMVKDGKEMPPTPETGNWSGSTENYTLLDKDGGTELNVSVDIVESHEAYFLEAFPAALERVRQLAESA